MPKIIVIRHSRALANEQGILMGANFDSALSEEGEAIARQKGQAFKIQNVIPDRVFTAKLTRAKQTAQIILEKIGAQPVATELAGLNERSFGEHEGKPYQSVFDAFETFGQDPPTIEPVEVFVERVTSAWEQILAATTDGTTLVVTHSNPEMVLQCLALQPDKVTTFWELGDPAYCEGFELSI